MEKITKSSLSLSETSSTPPESLLKKEGTSPRESLWEYIDSPKKNDSNDTTELNKKLFPKDIEK